MIGCDHRALAQGLLIAAHRIICAESSLGQGSLRHTRASSATHLASAQHGRASSVGRRAALSSQKAQPYGRRKRTLAACSSSHEAAWRRRARVTARDRRAAAPRSSKGRSPRVGAHSPTVIAGLALRSALRYRRAAAL